jgi:hypothetical protein
MNNEGKKRLKSIMINRNNKALEINNRIIVKSAEGDCELNST